MDHARHQRPASILGLTSLSSRLRKLRNDCLAGRAGEPILRSPTRKHVFIGRDGGAKPRQRPRLAGQRRQSAGVLPSKILKTREFSALRRNTRFPRNAWWSQAESNRRPLAHPGPSLPTVGLRGSGSILPILPSGGAADRGKFSPGHNQDTDKAEKF